MSEMNDRMQNLQGNNVDELIATKNGDNFMDLDKILELSNDAR